MPDQSKKMEVTKSVTTKKNNDGSTYEINEYKFQGKVTNYVHKCFSDGPCVIEFDGIAVNFGPNPMTWFYKKVGGGVEWLKPNSFDRDKYIGMQAEVSCYQPSISSWKTWKNIDGETVDLCIPYGDPKYYVRFKP